MDFCKLWDHDKTSFGQRYIFSINGLEGYVPDIWYYQGAFGNKVAFMDIVLHNPMRDGCVQSISSLQNY